MNQDVSSYEGPIPGNAPQCPRAPISIQEADKDSRIGRASGFPFNPGGEPHAVIEKDGVKNGNTVPGKRGADGNGPVN